MTMIFRKLCKKRNWDCPEWMGEEEAPADAAKCLETHSNTLSIYVLADPDEQLDRVVAALALTRNHLGEFDLAVAPEPILTECGLTIEDKQGDTPDLEVNHWHRDISQLTLGKVAQLAASIRVRGSIVRYQEKQVENAIRTSVNSEYVRSNRIPPTLVTSLERKGILRPR